MKKQQQGFAVVQLLLGLIIVAAISGVGWYVYKASDAADETNGNAQQASSSTVIDDGSSTEKSTEVKSSANDPLTETSFKIELGSDGMYLVTSDQFGFQFSYPEKFGTLKKEVIEETEYTKSDEYAYEGTFTSENSLMADTSYAVGVTGGVELHVYKKNVQLPTRKYGPLVQLKDKKWIVTEASEGDVIENKVGDEYKDFSGKTVQATKVNNLELYVFVSGDEGVSSEIIKFEVNGRIFAIRPASYSDGMYGGSQTEPNDRAPYDELVNQIKSSIKAI